MRTITLISATAVGLSAGPAFALEVTSSAIVAAAPDKIWEQGASDDEASSVIEGIYKAGLDEITKTGSN